MLGRTFDFEIDINRAGSALDSTRFFSTLPIQCREIHFRRPLELQGGCDELCGKWENGEMLGNSNVVTMTVQEGKAWLMQ